MRKPSSLTRRELDIMSVLWASHGATVTEIRKRLPDALASQTVHTMLRLLETKGWVTRALDGRAHIYHPAVGPDDAGDGVLDRLLAKVYRGSRALLMSRLIADDRISAAELREMQRLIRSRLKDAE